MSARIEKITPFLRFDRPAEKAAAFDVAIFPDAAVLDVPRHDHHGVQARPCGE